MVPSPNDPHLFLVVVTTSANQIVGAEGLVGGSTAM